MVWPGTTQLTETPSAMPVLYRKLPESLEHMAFGMDRDSVLHPVLEAVKSRSSIKTVTVQIWTGGELHKHLSKLKIECAWRGIHLTVTNNVRLFRSMTVSFCGFYYKKNLKISIMIAFN